MSHDWKQDVQQHFHKLAKSFQQIIIATVVIMTVVILSTASILKRMMLAIRKFQSVSLRNTIK